MTAGKLIGLLIALVLIAGGGFLALAGWGTIGGSGEGSTAWSIVGALLAGLGVALVISVLQNSRR